MIFMTWPCADPPAKAHEYVLAQYKSGIQCQIVRRTTSLVILHQIVQNIKFLGQVSHSAAKYKFYFYCIFKGSIL